MSTRRLITPEIDNMIDKALVVLDDAQKRIDSAKLAGIGVRTRGWLDLNQKRNDLLALKKSAQRQQGKRAYIDETKIGFLKKASKATYYDEWIEYNLSYSTPQSKKSKKTGRLITDYVRGRKWVSQKEINAIRKKEERGTASAEEVQLLGNWQDATSTATDAINVTLLPKIDRGIAATDEQRAQIIRAKRNKRTLDLSVGGQSTIINDLSYFLGSKFKSEVIRSFIDWLRSAMSKDKKFFAEVENLYRNNTALRMSIDNAKGANWYKQYKLIIAALEEMMQILENHYGDTIDFKSEFDEIHELVQEKAMEDI